MLGSGFGGGTFHLLFPAWPGLQTETHGQFPFNASEPPPGSRNPGVTQITWKNNHTPKSSRRKINSSDCLKTIFSKRFLVNLEQA